MKRLICRLFGHKYRLWRKIIPGTRELVCTRCRSLFAMNDATQSLLPMDYELQELHEEIIATRERPICTTSL